jgi:hypothetical protein
MLSYQKNGLLSLLAQFKVKLYEVAEAMRNSKKIISNEMDVLSSSELKALSIIDRNLTSIEKQIKKLSPEPTERQANQHIRNKEKIYSNLF